MGPVDDLPSAGFHFEAGQSAGGGEHDGNAQIESGVQAGLNAPDDGFRVGTTGA